MVRQAQLSAAPRPTELCTGHLLSRESWEVSAFMGVGSLQDLLKLRSLRSANAGGENPPE